MEDFDLSVSQLKGLDDSDSDHNAEIALGSIASRWLTGGNNNNRQSNINPTIMEDASLQGPGTGAGGNRRASLVRHGSHTQVADTRKAKRNTAAPMVQPRGSILGGSDPPPRTNPRGSILGLSMFAPKPPSVVKRNTSAPKIQPRGSIFGGSSTGRGSIFGGRPSFGKSSGGQSKPRPSILGLQMFMQRGGAADQSTNLMDVSMMDVDFRDQQQRASEASGLANWAEIAMHEVGMDESSKRISSSNVGETKVGDRDKKWWLSCLGYLAVLAILGALLILTMPQVDAFRKKPSRNGNQTIQGNGQVTEAPKETETLVAIPEEEPFEGEEKEESFEAIREEDLVPELRQRLEALESILHEKRISSQSDLKTSGTATNRAMQWLAIEDPAKLPMAYSSHVFQRYALAVFYFSQKDPSGMEEDMSTATYEAGVGGPANIKQQKHARNDQVAVANQTFLDSTWLSEKSICHWHGVFCDQRKVKKVYLPRTGLGGTIPPEMLSDSALPHMKHLDLTHNHLHGTLPTTTSKHLEHLLLGHNRLTGSIPSDILQDLPALAELDLSNNTFTGDLPRAPSDLPTTGISRLQVLSLNNNELAGKIPKSYGESLVGLKRLNLHDNQGIKGSVPSELGLLPQLERLQLDGTSLTGEMPQPICQLRRNASLRYLVTDCADETNSDGGGGTKFKCDCCTQCF